MDIDISPFGASTYSTGRPARIVNKAEIHSIFQPSRPWGRKHQLRAAIQRFALDTISQWEPHRSSSQEQFVAMRPIVIDCSENSKHEYKKCREKSMQRASKVSMDPISATTAPTCRASFAKKEEEKKRPTQRQPAPFLGIDTRQVHRLL